MSGKKSKKSLEFKVKSAIYGHGRGWCFTPADFSVFKNDLAVLQSLTRLHQQGVIRRLSWGLYEYSRKHNKLGILPPDAEQVVQAIIRKNKIRVLPSGALAANLLGLSDQVPAKSVYFTEGVAKRIRIGNREIIFKTTTPKIMATAGTPAGLIIQALKYLGKDQVSEVTIAILKKRLTKAQKDSLRKYVQYAPAWIKKVMLLVSGEKQNG